MTPSHPEEKPAAAEAGGVAAASRSQERRRSTRIPRQTAAAAAAAAAAASSPVEDPDGSHSSPASPIKPLPDTMAEHRRNPKRKASEAASQLINMPDNLLEEALRPLTAEDIQDWEGWVELESEPAFFNIILRDLGVKDVKAQEIFSIDPGSLDLLPRPVFGLIFLFEFDPGDEESESEDDTDLVWFANQTTHNACATVALLNIVMNSDQVELGDRLREFKNSTKHLSTALRGYHLSKNSYIRTIHNSFTRRMDHLNADLALENEASSAEATAHKRRAAKRGIKKAARSKKKVDDVYGYHFIAYVPAGGFVWELDGLRNRPYRLGPIKDQDSWTTIARPRIRDRIMKYETSQLSFNLLALCESPLATHSRSIAQNLAATLYVRNQMKDRPDFASLITSDDYSFPDMVDDAAQLAEFNIGKSDIEAAAMPDILSGGEISNMGVGDAYELYERLVTDAKAAIGEFRAELVALAEDEIRVKGRKKDYGQALHKWVQKLAEKNVLEEVIKQSSGGA